MWCWVAVVGSCGLTSSSPSGEPAGCFDASYSAHGHARQTAVLPSAERCLVSCPWGDLVKCYTFKGVCTVLLEQHLWFNACLLAGHLRRLLQSEMRCSHTLHEKSCIWLILICGQRITVPFFCVSLFQNVFVLILIACSPDSLSRSQGLLWVCALAKAHWYSGQSA